MLETAKRRFDSHINAYVSAFCGEKLTSFVPLACPISKMKKGTRLVKEMVYLYLFKGKPPVFFPFVTHRMCAAT